MSISFQPKLLHSNCKTHVTKSLVLFVYFCMEVSKNSCTESHEISVSNCNYMTLDTNRLKYWQIVSVSVRKISLFYIIKQQAVNIYLDDMYEHLHRHTHEYYFILFLDKYSLLNLFRNKYDCIVITCSWIFMRLNLCKFRIVV